MAVVVNSSSDDSIVVVELRDAYDLGILITRGFLELRDSYDLGILII